MCILNGIGLSNPILMRYAVKLIVLSGKLFCLSVIKDSCEQSGVNTIESLQGFRPLYIGEFWPPFIMGNVVSTMSVDLSVDQSVRRLVNHSVRQ